MAKRDVIITEEKNTTFVNNAIEFYKKDWEKAWDGHSYKQKCEFQGNIDDIEMLDFYVYELEFPEDNYYHASIIWGNVLQKNSNLVWGRDINDSLVLYSGPNGYPCFLIHPYQRVIASIYSTITQFDNFANLTQKVILEMMDARFDIEEIPELFKMAVELDDTVDFSAGYRYCYELNELYKETNKTERIKEMLDLLNGIEQ